MKKIANPYLKYGDGYNCFGCSPYNTVGLKLNFYEKDESMYAEWIPNRDYMGFPGILHGGIQATIFDEIASWIICTQLDTSGVTIRLDVQYIEPVKINEKKVIISANIKSRDKKFAIVHTELTTGKGRICSTAEIVYRIFPREVAKKKLYFPGREAFYPKKN